MGNQTSHTWQELSGETKWAGMLDPLDDELRMYLIHYGERVQALGDAFNNVEASPSCNFSRYPMKDFFSYVGLEVNNPFKYEVKRFVYTKNFMMIGETTWIAYVAVTTDEGVKTLGRRDILVVWRGTVRAKEALADLDDTQEKAEDVFPGEPGIEIHQGWHYMYTYLDLLLHDEYTKTSSRTQVLEEIESLMKTYSHEDMSITVVGHSMGGSLAILNGADIVNNKKNVLPGGKVCPVTVFTFESPKVGNEEFQKKVDGLDNLHILRTENVLDMVPHMPPVNYYPVGQVLWVDSRESKYLKNLTSGATLADMLGTAHQLEPLLHLIAGTKGLGKGFDLKGRRQLALVNKNGDYLTDAEAKANEAPPSWWVVKNKGMIQKSNDGKWVLNDYKPAP
ncbi:hypothetical protein MLD38_037088 [Melastoma candidum]|uniref:Uncharacterized protein n=1 Tax=Melastoma candidum TaxID=119954 RepID=A0ACB9LMF4_9MYRT|nr:hypothetical protein MLD38_037088 [Melastoma candidum]